MNRPSGSDSFEVLTLELTLGNGSGTDFQASQCIPIQAATLALPLTLGVVIALITLSTSVNVLQSFIGRNAFLVETLLCSVKRAECTENI